MTHPHLPSELDNITTNPATLATLIELDPRRRTTLRLGHHDRYLATEEPDGTLVFRPAVILTADDAVLRSNPDLANRLDRSLNDPAARTRKRSRPTER